MWLLQAYVASEGFGAFREDTADKSSEFQIRVNKSTIAFRILRVIENRFAARLSGIVLGGLGRFRGICMVEFDGESAQNLCIRGRRQVHDILAFSYTCFRSSQL